MYFVFLILDMSGLKRGRGGKASAQAPEEVEGEPEINVGKPQSKPRNVLIQNTSLNLNQLHQITSQSQQVSFIFCIDRYIYNSK